MVLCVFGVFFCETFGDFNNSVIRYNGIAGFPFFETGKKQFAYYI